MLRISKLTDYAIIILADLAVQPKHCSTAKAIAERTELGLATVKKILRQLMQSSLLTSVQGINGGYAFTRPAQYLTVAEIIKAMEGDIAITECSTKNHDCSKITNCNVSKNWQHINKIIFKALESVSINEMRCSKNEWQPIQFDSLQKGCL